MAQTSTPGSPAMSSPVMASSYGGFLPVGASATDQRNLLAAHCSSFACFAAREATLSTWLVTGLHWSQVCGQSLWWPLAPLLGLWPPFDSLPASVAVLVLARLLMRRTPQYWTNLVSELKIGLRFGRLVVLYRVSVLPSLLPIKRITIPNEISSRSTIALVYAVLPLALSVQKHDPRQRVPRYHGRKVVRDRRRGLGFVPLMSHQRWASTNRP